MPSHAPYSPLSLRPGCPSGSLKRDLALSVGTGIAIILVIGLGMREVLVPVEFFKSVLLCILISLLSQLMMRFVGRRVGPLAGLRRTALQAAILFVAGDLGFLIVVAAQALLHSGPFHMPWRWLVFPLPVVGGIAVVFGLLLFSFDLQRQRLSESVARLKEAEFAERELELARHLQSRLLPPPALRGEGYRIEARNLAARVVAGDFYDVFPLDGGALGLVVADVAGKGMAAALIMASVKAMLPLLAAERSPEEAMIELNRRLAGELSPREFVALAFARFDPASGALTLTNAGLPDPYRLAAGRPAEVLSVPGPRLPLGVRHRVEYESLEVTLEAGERLLVHSDGLAEAPTANGEPLGYEALGAFLDDAAESEPAGWLDALLERVRHATSHHLEDDWTALLLERTAAA